VDVCAELTKAIAMRITLELINTEKFLAEVWYVEDITKEVKRLEKVIMRIKNLAKEKLSSLLLFAAWVAKSFALEAKIVEKRFRAMIKMIVSKIGLQNDDESKKANERMIIGMIKMLVDVSGKAKEVAE
jgi:hypothetical protein